MLEAAPANGKGRRMEIGAEQLEAWALGYLGRYASSAENLRRVLRRRARRHIGSDREREREVAALIDALVARYRDAGLLDDAAYAAGRAEALFRRGESQRAIRARLKSKGVAAPLAAEAVAGLGADRPDPDLAAACAFARRRRLGPFRLRPAERRRELAAFARAGFSRPVAEAVLGCADAEAAEALSRDGLA